MPRPRSPEKKQRTLDPWIKEEEVPLKTLPGEKQKKPIKEEKKDKETKKHEDELKEEEYKDEFDDDRTDRIGRPCG